MGFVCSKFSLDELHTKLIHCWSELNKAIKLIYIFQYLMKVKLHRLYLVIKVIKL